MKRFAVLGLTALLVLSSTASTARAQLTMQMTNGWNFTFAGNVNAFYVEQWSNSLHAATAVPIDGGLVAQGQGTVGNIRTGLLPATVAFDAKGKEGDLNIDVHFGFYPEIQNGGCAPLSSGGTGAPCVGNSHDQFGAQIDMREVYLTVGSTWGQILAGREIDLYQRQNILTDATLFGVGATGGNLAAGGTTLGRIGMGYVYPNFNAQITYSSPATSPLVLSVGVFQPSNIGGGAYGYTPYPRVESEITYTGKIGQGDDASKVMLWVNGMWQQARDKPTGVDTLTNDTGPNATHKVDALGAGGGLKLDLSRISLVGSGYYGRGLGTVFLFNGAGLGAGALDNNPNGAQLRSSYGYIGQASIKLTPKLSVVGSWGESMTTGTNYDNNPLNVVSQDFPLLKYNALGVGSIVYQATKSFKWVLEYDYTEAANQHHDKAVANQAATGFMVFF